jgi:hypothetical protein
MPKFVCLPKAILSWPWKIVPVGSLWPELNFEEEEEIVYDFLRRGEAFWVGGGVLAAVEGIL